MRTSPSYIILARSSGLFAFHVRLPEFLTKATQVYSTRCCRYHPHRNLSRLLQTLYASLQYLSAKRTDSPRFRLPQLALQVQPTSPFQNKQNRESTCRMLLERKGRRETHWSRLGASCRGMEGKSARKHSRSYPEYRKRKPRKAAESLLRSPCFGGASHRGRRGGRLLGGRLPDGPGANQPTSGDDLRPQESFRQEKRRGGACVRWRAHW